MAQRLGAYALALLVLAGQFKEHPALAWLEWDLTLIAAALVAACVAFAAFTLGRPSGKIVIPIALWAALMPTIATATSGYGATKITTLYTITLALAIAPFFLLRTEVQRRSFLHALIAAGFIAVLDVMQGGRSVELYGRVAAEGTDTIGTARVAMAGAIALVVLAIQRGRARAPRVVFIGLAGALAVIALMTGSRGPALAAAIALFTAVTFAPMFRKQRVRSLVGMGALGAVAVFVVANEGNAGFSRILSFLNGETDRSSSTRTLLWESAWDGIQRNPFGYGWGSFAEIGGINPYPHNLLLEVGFEAGVIPAMVLAVVLLAAIVAAARRATDAIGVAYFALLIFGVFNAMVSSDVNGSRLLVVTLFASWAIGYRLPGGELTETAAPRRSRAATSRP